VSTREIKAFAETSPETLMTAALGRRAAQAQLNSMIRLAYEARNFLAEFDRLCPDPKKIELDAMVRWLSHENRRPHQIQEGDINGYIDRMSEELTEFKRQLDLQKMFNRVRLSLLQDVDFQCGTYWSDLLEECKGAATASTVRRRPLSP
jgi:hypothetical protein